MVVKMDYEEYIKKFMESSGKTREEVEQLAIIKNIKECEEKEEQLTIIKKPINWA